MNLSEKIRKVTALEERQEELKKSFYEADMNKNEEEKDRIAEEIKQLSEEMNKINESYKNQREERVVDEKISTSAADFLNRGKNIKSRIEEYTNALNDSRISDEERTEIQHNIDKLKEENEKLKNEICDKAMESSGLSWKDDGIYPDKELKENREVLSELENQKRELETQKEKQQQIIETKKNRMNEQFNIAIQKYQAMLDSGKISQELFDSRIENMKAAKTKDAEMLDKSLEDIDKNINEKSKEIDEVKGKISALEEKEKIFDEYNNVYYELFGETLDNISRERTAAQKEQSSNKEKKEQNANKNAENISYSSPNVNNSKENEQKNNTEKANEEKEDEKIVVTSKKGFDELYKKLTKGTINDKELTALTDVLNDKNNYDKYGITTGMVFNKAKKILKHQGNTSFKNIEAFLKNSNTFSDDIKFDTSIENDEVLSHETLTSLKDSQESLVHNESVFSVEKYIEKIEAYKEAGNELTDEQQKIYKDAMEIKQNLVSYRKALNINEEIAAERSEKSHNSVFYNMFKGKTSTKALPEVNKPENSETIVIDKPFGIELGSLVNEDPSTDIDTKHTKTRTKDRGEKSK